MSTTIPPDVFASHVEQAAELGRVLSVKEASKLNQDGIREPLISFWFDDGCRGVFKYAKDILDEYDAPGALSVCSGFASHQELFWRLKLCYLNATDGHRFVRSALRNQGFSPKGSMLSQTLDYFSPDVYEAINRVFEQCTTARTRHDAFRLFSSGDEIQQLHQLGWTIANHSARHWPVSENSALQWFDQEFIECEKYLEELIGAPTEFWVLPFDRPAKRAAELEQAIKRHPDRTIVYVGNRPNNAQSNARSLYRISPQPEMREIQTLLSRQSTTITNPRYR